VGNDEFEHRYLFLYTGSVFVYELAGACSSFEEGASVAAHECKP
jgi:hypothetical protein